MKKLFLALCVAVLSTVCCFSLSACGNKKVKIGVQNGTTGEYYIGGNEDYPGFDNLEATSYANGGLAVNEMKNGNVKYVVLDEAPANYLKEKITGIKVIDIKLTEEEYAFGVNKADEQLLSKTNEYLNLIRTNGVFDEILNRYFGDGTPQGIQSASQNNSNENGQLVVATNASFAPFEYKEGDKFYGIDMEIAKGLADYLGMELVISDMDFDAVVTSVGKNGVDIAMAGLTVSETRRQSVNFSNTYYLASQKVICLDSDTAFDNCKTIADVEEILKNLK